MARPIYQHELIDPDFAWLINTFKESHPEYTSIECSGIPVVLVRLSDSEFQQSLLPMLPQGEGEDTERKDSTE